VLEVNKENKDQLVLKVYKEPLVQMVLEAEME
jgi:hypothetical protein